MNRRSISPSRRRTTHSGQALLEETHDIKAVQKLLGHASPTTTMEHYVDYDEFQMADMNMAAIQRRRES